MKEKNVCYLEKINENDSVLLKRGINFVDNQGLKPFLSMDNRKNSTLIFKETNEIPVSDLIQIRANVKNYGYFLINFKNSDENNDICLKILEEFSQLKNKENFTKIHDVIEILNNYNPLYVTFVSESECSDIFKTEEYIDISFPLVFIDNNKKQEKIKKAKQKEIKFFFECPFFSFDYLFNLLFSLFASFSLYLGTLLLENKNLKGLLFVFLSIALISLLYYCMFLVLYKEHKIKKDQIFVIGLYLVAGCSLGLIFSVLICHNYLKIPYSTLSTIVIIISYLVTIFSLFGSKFFKIFHIK